MKIVKQKFTILLAMLALTSTSVIGEVRPGTYGHSQTIIDNDYAVVWLFGGELEGGQLSGELWTYEPAISKYTHVSAPLGGPCARKNHSAFSKDGKLYIQGGVDANGNCLNDLWSYEHNFGIWQLVNNVQKCASKSTATKIPGKGVFTVGGKAQDYLGQDFSTDYNNLITGPDWIPVLQPQLPEPLAGSGSFVKNGTLNIFGGFWHDWDPGTPGNQPRYSQNTWQFTPAQSGWTSLTTTGAIKELTDMAYCQDTLENYSYVFGGKTYNYGTSTESLSDSIFKLDLNTNVWTKLSTTLPQALAEFTASYLHGASGNDTIYLIGGVTSTGTISSAIYALVVSTNSLITISTSINDIRQLNEKMSLFPNPVSDIFTIKMSETEQITKIEITNSLGKLVQSIDNPTSREINLSQQNSGLYFIRIDTKTNRYFNKLVKQ